MKRGDSGRKLILIAEEGALGEELEKLTFKGL